MIDQIDHFFTRPNRHVAWHEEPHPINHSYVLKEKRWAIHENGIDSGAILAMRYSTASSTDEFSLALCLKHDFCRLDMRRNGRAVSQNHRLIEGPAYFSWELNRSTWTSGNNVGRLAICEPCPIGVVEFRKALEWFLLANGVAEHGIPTNLRLRR